MKHRSIKGLLALLLVALAALAALAWRPSIAQSAPAPRSAFEPGLLRQGEQLAAIGNCASCHTAPEGPPFAGGTALKTPFGTIYGSNITPDPETGIGGWSEDAFRRALREGVSRDGHLLYPAFPYDHFTRLQDQDIAALYTFVMTRDPVRFVPPANKLVFPLQFRPLIAGWNLLYLDKGPRPPQASQSADWNRGAYLVDALAHCAACHSPRNQLGAERRDAAFDGGEAEGWHATALNVHSPSPVPWSAEALAAYLQTGLVADHAITAGPMQDVVHSLSHAPVEDVHAIAVYVQSLMGAPTPQQQARESASRQRASQPSVALPTPAGDAQLALGAGVFASSCASCHDLGRQLSSASGLRMPLAIALYLPDPRNLVHIVRDGIQPPPGQPGRWMPAFDGELSDDQIAALAAWLRQVAAAQPPWLDLAQAVQDSRKPSP
ncbi:c-type cytochrome [Caenimonas terrae]|uniref:C-type cytochrome n=1 Tax=Caenimonas terrae TaxID=696074 RepID=A0ABW0NCX8_9BURK